MISANYCKALCLSLSLGISSLLMAQKPYFQQEVNYKIEVSLDDTKHLLSAFESLEYINHSPDTLKFLYFHLWPNAYKNNQTAFAKQQLENGDTKFYYSSPKDKGWIDSLDFNINGAKAKWDYDATNMDICKIFPEQPILPGEKILITTPFKVKIPGSFSRFGHVGQSYQITQWYPKPAVYDRDGWHQFPYLDQGEFYSEFGSYDVSITLPDQYVVGATGELQTETEKKWLDCKAGIGCGISETKLFSNNETSKTIRYTEKNVHDFTWFADKTWLVSKDSVKVPTSGTWVTTWAMYPPKDSVRWNKATEYINDAVYLYSKWYGDYPYKNCSAVRGAIEAGGAMEYPGITVVGSAGTDLVLETMIMHEVGHNWFYGILGFNERDYPYLDEGFNSFSELRYIDVKYHRSKLVYEMGLNDKRARFANIEDIPYQAYYELSFLTSQHANLDQPMVIRSTDFTGMNYGSVVYHKSALAYYYLMESLGEEKFNSIMQNFYREWQFKHPQPSDFRAAFESQSDSSLNWFFDKLLTTTNQVDYKAARIKDNKILVKNKGQIASPVKITGYQGNQIQFSFMQPGFDKLKWIELPSNTCDRISVNNIESPEYNRKNNMIKTSGLFKKAEPLEIDKLQVFEKTDNTQLGLIPAAGWNLYDNFMVGLLFYNPVIPMQKIEYQLLPMYAFGSNEIAGAGKITLHTYPEISFIRKVDYSITAHQFASTNKLRAVITLNLNKRIARSPINQKVNIFFTTIDTLPVRFKDRIEFYNVQYSIKNKNVLHPFNWLLNFELADNSSRITSLFNLTIPIKYSKEAVTIRWFGGYIFDKGDNYPFMLSGGAQADYQHDLVFPGRYEPYSSGKTFSYQYAVNQCGFTAYSPFTGKTWMTTAQVKVSLPKLPLKVYGTIGSYSEAGKDFSSIPDNIKTNRLAYEAGLELALGKLIEVYFPITVSNDINTYLDNSTEKFVQRIRFTFNLPLMNPFDIRDRMIE